MLKSVSGILTALTGLILSALLTAQPSQAQLKLVTEVYPPFNYLDEAGEITGVSTDILKELMERSKISYTITVLPWKRAYLRALSEAETCVYSTAETDERKDLFQWVGPIVQNDWVLFAKKGRFDRQMSLEEAGKYRIGGYPGDAITQYLIGEGLDVEVTGKDTSNLKKLMVDRIDLWPSGLVIGNHLARNSGFEIEAVVSLKTVRVSLACNKGMSAITLSTMRATLKEMEEDGSLARIKGHYGDNGGGPEDGDGTS